MKKSLGQEGEYGIGWYKEVDGMTMDVLLSYDDLDGIFQGPKNDLFNVYMKLAKSLVYDTYGTLKPFMELAYFKAGPKSDFEGGTRMRGGVEYSHRLFVPDMVYELSLMRDDGTFGTNPAWIVRHEGSLSWKVSGWKVKFPLLLAYVPVSSDSGRSNTTVFGAKIARDF
ncbi:MAG: hypothetical protein AAB775_00070 [Patescibacteria group bacterium]